MEISGIRIDFKEIMSKARCAILEEFSTKPWRFVSGTRIAQFDLVIREQVWHELSDYLKGITGKKDGNIRAEEGVLENRVMAVGQRNPVFGPYLVDHDRLSLRSEASIGRHVTFYVVGLVPHDSNVV